MSLIRQSLLNESAGIKASEDARKLRDAKKFGKKVQVERLKEREKDKKDVGKRLESLKKSTSYSLLCFVGVVLMLGEQRGRMEQEVDSRRRRTSISHSRTPSLDLPSDPRRSNPSVEDVEVAEELEVVSLDEDETASLVSEQLLRRGGRKRTMTGRTGMGPVGGDAGGDVGERGVEEEGGEVRGVGVAEGVNDLASLVGTKSSSLYCIPIPFLTHPLSHIVNLRVFTFPSRIRLFVSLHYELPTFCSPTTALPRLDSRLVHPIHGPSSLSLRFLLERRRRGGEQQQEIQEARSCL